MLIESTWHGVPAWVLENEYILVIFLPQKGGKICSLIDKRKKHEWLIDPGNRPLQKVPYGAVYIQQEMCGWDEMFPTIDACSIKLGQDQAKEISLPDHGELWTMEWTIEESSHNLFIVGVNGKAFPYHFSRRAAIIDNAKLELTYLVKNLGQEPFPYLWTAHPQFTATQDTVIEIPAKVTSVYNVVDMPQWGGHGTIYPWPFAIRLDGKVQSLNRVRSANFHECYKFYIPAEVETGWAKLFDLSDGSTLCMEWDKPVRYLGILVDEGKFNPESVVALEPSTGFYDALDRACELKRASILNPQETHTWRLTLSFDD
jgi:galactose mutarotase-like enzyme